MSIICKKRLCFNYRTDRIEYVTQLFFAYLRSVQLFQQYPSVVLLDCTYKTNRFKMPLLIIIGTTCLNLSYYTAFCFLRQAKEEDYIWALEQLKTLYLPYTRTEVFLTDRELALINVL